MNQAYTISPIQVIERKEVNINIFSTEGTNIDNEVVKTFGEEWTKFKDYSDEEIRLAGAMYFDILNDSIINKNTYALDIGCGTGRWTLCLSERIGFIEAIDPSDAIFAAADLLKDVKNVRLTKASIETIPFPDETFDFVMSIGVLHHIPNTQQAIIDCVKKLKTNGYFYCYLYYNLEDKSIFYKSLFWISNLFRMFVCKFPPKLKRFTCDILAVLLYMPFVLLGRILNFMGLQRISKNIPLSDYTDKSFFVIRNDSLDRFGTKLEQRFSKQEVIDLMTKAGLSDIIVSESSPYYHAIGKRK